MNDSLLWGGFLITFVGIVTISALLVVVGVILAPMIIHKADKALSILLPDNELLFQGLPLSYTRLGTYGRMLLLKDTGWYQSRVFDQRPDRERAIAEMPVNLRRTVTWLYGAGSLICFFTVLLMIIFLLLDR